MKLQKRYLALAVAGFASAPAFAQSNVTIYGLLDIGVRSLTATGKDRLSEVGSMSSQIWGLKGSEDLGNGLSAGFVLEGGINTDTGAIANTGKLFGRQSFLSLSNKQWGTLQAGRMNTLARTYFVKYDVHPGYSAASPLGAFVTPVGFSIAGNGMDSDANGARANNMVMYVSPAINGLTLEVAHSFNESPTAGATSSATTGLSMNELSANYDNGPFSVSYVYHSVAAILGDGSQLRAGTRVLGNAQEHYVGSSYNFGPAKIFGAYQTRKFANLTTKDKAYQVGVSVPVTAQDTFSLSYAKLDVGSDLEGFANPSTSILGQAGATWNDIKGWGASFKHDLSKRTNLYAIYMRGSNSGNGTIGVRPTGYLPSTGGSSSVFAVGAQHSF